MLTNYLNDKIMNYYKQGDAANADRIKAAFEKLGYDTTDWKFNVEGGFYYTNEGEIDMACSKFLINLIMTHPDYKELELPVEPLFKVGDSLQSGSYWARIRRIDAENRRYICDFDNVIPFEEQELWSLVPNSKPHYGISNFYAGMPVLVRETSLSAWQYVLFSHCYVGGDGLTRFNAGLVGFTQCIPFSEDTKHLLGTSDMCPEEYINW